MVIDCIELTRAYRGERGRFWDYVTGVTSHNEVLPYWAYYQGYKFVFFRTQGDVDPYALIDPESRVVKVWPGKPPSLTELADTIPFR